MTKMTWKVMANLLVSQLIPMFSMKPLVCRNVLFYFESTFLHSSCAIGLSNRIVFYILFYTWYYRRHRECQGCGTIMLVINKYVCYLHCKYETFEQVDKVQNLCKCSKFSCCTLWIAVPMRFFLSTRFEYFDGRITEYWC